MKAVVMAGGEGSRLRPLTSRRPKPLAPIANKPVMHHILDLLRRHGITEVVGTLHYLADEIESYFGDGSEYGVSLRYVVEDTPLGTAGAVKLAEEFLRDDTVVIVSGDALTDIDLGALLAFHREKKSVATITLQRVENPLEFGVVVTDAEARVTRFLEKPSWGEVFSDTINTGIYVLEPEFLAYMERGKVYDFSKDLFPQMLQEGKPLFGYVTSAYWTDIGNLQQYQQANVDALSGAVRVEVAGTQIRPGVWVGENTRIDPSATLIAPVVIGANVSVDHDAVIGGHTVIGDSSIVGPWARVDRSVVWESAYVGESAVLDSCTIADRNIIRERVQIGEGAVIGSRCTIGSDAIVNPHVKMWPDKSVAAGGVVSMSLIYGIKWPGSLFGADGITGIGNIDITPEFAMKLGQAYGSFLKPGQHVRTSRDMHPASRIMNRCIISGLLSVGINVDDLRAYPTPLARFSVRTGADGGIHVRVAPKDPASFLIEFFDANGINVEKALERKIENLFFREDFRRTPMDAVGKLGFPSRVLEGYTDAFMASLNPTAVKRANFKVAIDYAYGNTALFLPRILGNFGLEMIALNAYFDEAKARSLRNDTARNMQQLSNIVTTLDASLGIFLDHDGESLTLVDDKGRVIEKERLQALIALLVARAKPGAHIAVPVTAPSAIETIAKANGASVTRTRNDRRALMSLALSDPSLAFACAGGAYEIMFPEFQPAFDALYGTGKILELLAAENRKLSELVDLLPELHLASADVKCPWERKGTVMRHLIDQHRDTDLDLLDGIRVLRDDGWVLILPDATDPLFHIVAESGSMGEAKAIVEDYAARVTALA
jgi:mannose-1-phosphate guanylyltransferase/phosphomannomutase